MVEEWYLLRAGWELCSMPCSASSKICLPLGVVMSERKVTWSQIRQVFSNVLVVVDVVCCMASFIRYWSCWRGNVSSWILAQPQLLRTYAISPMAMSSR